MQSGQNVVVRWSDTNTGTGATSTSWNDSVTVVNVTTGVTLVNAVQVPYSNLGGNP